MVTLTENEKSVNLDRSLVARYMHDLGMLVPAARFEDCEEGGKGWVGMCPDGHEVYHSFCCEQRICPRCAGRRSRNLQEKLVPALLKKCDAAPADFSLKMVTLGSNINLVDYMDLGKDGRLNWAALWALRWQVLRLRDCVAELFRKYKSEGKVLGFAIGVEFGGKAATLHFHVLALMQFIDVFKMGRDWEKMNGRSGSYSWIREIPHREKSFYKAVGYVCKYITKPLGMGERDTLDTPSTFNVERFSSWLDAHGVESVVAALAFVFKGVRRFQTYAGFYNLEFEDQEKSVCSAPHCGKELYWISEMEYLSGDNAAVEFLKTLSTNKFLIDPGFGMVRMNDPPVNVLLPGF